MSRKRTRELHNRDSRAAFGCIVSFVSDSGAELTIHRTGLTRETLPQVCADALAVDPTFRVVAYSTPQTIYDDLQGRGLDFDSATGHRVEPSRPEVQVLAQCGLGHMAHPRLRLGIGDSDAQRRRRERGQRVKG